MSLLPTTDWWQPCSFCHGFEGTYVVSVNGEPVFNLEDIDVIIAKLYSSPDSHDTIQIELAPEKKCDHSKGHATPAHL